MISKVFYRWLCVRGALIVIPSPCKLFINLWRSALAGRVCRSPFAVRRFTSRTTMHKICFGLSASESNMYSITRTVETMCFGQQFIELRKSGDNTVNVWKSQPTWCPHSARLEMKKEIAFTSVGICWGLTERWYRYSSSTRLICISFMQNAPKSWHELL